MLSRFVCALLAFIFVIQSSAFAFANGQSLQQATAFLNSLSSEEKLILIRHLAKTRGSEDQKFLKQHQKYLSQIAMKFSVERETIKVSVEGKDYVVVVSEDTHSASLDGVPFNLNKPFEETSEEISKKNSVSIFANFSYLMPTLQF